MQSPIYLAVLPVACTRANARMSGTTGPALRREGHRPMNEVCVEIIQLYSGGRANQSVPGSCTQPAARGTSGVGTTYKRLPIRQCMPQRRSSVQSCSISTAHLKVFQCFLQLRPDCIWMVGALGKLADDEQLLSRDHTLAEHGGELLTNLRLVVVKRRAVDVAHPALRCREKGAQLRVRSWQCNER